MSDDSEPDRYVELLEDLGRIFAELFTTPDEAVPDPIIGPLAERSVLLPEADFKALLGRLTPTDREAFWEHFNLIKQREHLVKDLWDRLLERRTQDDVPAGLHGAELQMTFSTHVVLLKMAWKLVLHMRGQDGSEGQMTAAFEQLYAEDPGFRELADSTSRLLRWQQHDDRP